MTDERLEKIAVTEGVIAVVLHRTDDNHYEVLPATAATTDWGQYLQASLRIYAGVRAAGLEGTVRVRIGTEEAVLIMGNPDDSVVVAIAYEQRSKIVKSLSRMARVVLGLGRLDRVAAPQRRPEPGLNREVGA